MPFITHFTLYRDNTKLFDHGDHFDAMIDDIPTTPSTYRAALRWTWT